MQHTPTTMEEQLILKAIKEECRWDSLPKRLQVMLTSKEEWHKRIVEHCIKKRLQWNNCFARAVCREGEYYEELMHYLRKNLALFPYHLAEYVCRVMRISPFKYYCDILFEVMKNEQPYDSIPNFSAADILRLTGVGRNEFIDIMNKCKSKKIMWKLNKSIAKELLPTQCIDFPIEPWWGICLVNFTLEEFKRLSDEESTVVDKVCNEEANSFFLFDVDIVKGLYYRGLIYFDVPVHADDRFKVSRLEGFVSNREQSYEDPIEELLYAVFVVSNENATVSELATTLQADLVPLQAAASFACRLGWAHKVIDPTFILRDSSISDFAALTINGEYDAFNTAEFPESVSSDHSGHDDYVIGKNTSSSGHTRVAFIVSADIASYLMMGSVSPGLKSHAVTLYEAGKLGDASIEDLCKDLGSLEDTKFEGGLQEFADHVFSLRCALECLRSGGVSSLSTSSGADEAVGTKKRKTYHLDLLRCESLAALAPVILNSLFLRDYDILVSMNPLPFSSAVLPGRSFPVHFGPPSYSSMSPWMKLVMYTSMGSGPLSVVIMKGHCLRSLPSPLSDCDKAILWSWDGGVGGRLGGGLIQGSTLLHHLNTLLKHTAVLVQPLRSHDLDDPSGKPVTLDLPLPLKKADGVLAHVGEDIVSCGEEREELDLLSARLSDRLGLETVGYVRFIRLFGNTAGRKWVPLGVEFGIPLSDPLLCRRICDRVVLSEILRTGSFTAYQCGARKLRAKLADICAEFRVTGSTAKRVYEQRKLSKGVRGHVIGRGNHVRDEFLGSASSFSADPAEKRRPEASSRRCCSREILSFDGRDVRSYTLEDGGEEREEVECENDGKEVVLPGLDLLFDGCELHVFEMGACLQGLQPAALISESFVATIASASSDM